MGKHKNVYITIENYKSRQAHPDHLSNYLLGIIYRCGKLPSYLPQAEKITICYALKGQSAEARSVSPKRSVITSSTVITGGCTLSLVGG